MPRAQPTEPTQPYHAAIHGHVYNHSLHYYKYLWRSEIITNLYGA